VLSRQINCVSKATKSTSDTRAPESIANTVLMVKKGKKYARFAKMQPTLSDVIK
jgi:hypothetical protein